MLLMLSGMKGQLEIIIHYNWRTEWAFRWLILAGSLHPPDGISTGGLAWDSLSIVVIATGVLHLLLQSTLVYIHSPFAAMMLRPPTLSIQIYAWVHTKKVLTFKSSARISWSRQLLLEIDTYIHRNKTRTAAGFPMDFNVHVCEILTL